MKKLVGICLLFLLAVCISAKTEIPVLVGDLGKKQQPLDLVKLSVDVNISGFIAETRMTMTFYNRHNRDLEGDLHFPLPEGAFVSGYALDINGKMVEGVVVEKTKGRIVFDEIVRRGVDPGLVEWVKGNNFKTSIYPIFRRGTRTVMVRYVSQLVTRKGKHYYHLPLKYNMKVKDFSLKVELASPEDEVNRDSTDEEDGLVLDDWKRQRIAGTKKKDFLLNEDILVPLPDVEQQTVTVEANEDGEFYFCVNDLQPVPEKFERQIPIQPKRVTVIWDTSRSRGNGAKKERRRELLLLEHYLSRLKRKRVAVDLYAFNIKKTRIGSYTVRNGDAGDVLRAIRGLTYDGGTTMEAISPGRGEKRPDLYLLFTDGNHNFAKEVPKRFKAPLYIFSASSGANHVFLHHIASLNNGLYFNLNRHGRGDIIESMGRSPYTLISVQSSGRGVADTYPQAGQPVQGTFTLTGKLLKKKTTITLNYGIRGKLVKQASFTLSRKDAAGGNVLRTFWAQKKVEALSAFAKTNRKALIELGKKYGLVTPGTSLIVLERLDDYIRYRIKPPKSMPGLREEWEDEMENIGYIDIEEAMKKVIAEELDDVVEEWEDLVEWWNKKFEFPKVKKPKKKTRRTGAASATPPARTTQSRQARTDEGTVQYDEERDLQSTVAVDARMGTGSITGKIILEDGSEIPGVMVALTSPALNVRVTAISSERGRYRVMGLPAGRFEIKFELEGFKTTTWKDIPLSRGQHITLRSIIMGTATLMEEITVSGASPVVDVRHSRVGISIKEWDPVTPYMKKLKKAKTGSIYNVYHEQGKKYGNAPGYYLDCANYLFRKGKKRQGLLVLSNLAELGLEDSSMLRILAYRLYQLGWLEESERIFEEVKDDRIEEPQSYRDLALVRERLGKYKSAAELLYRVALLEWDDRFDGINLIALVELNHVLARAKRKGLKTKQWGIDQRLIKLLDVDIRIVMTWDSDRADMDLWVIDPAGEKCYYGNSETKIGGRLSDDFTGGLGPEEYMIRRAMPGNYTIKVNYFGEDSAKMSAPVTVQVDIFTNYGRKSEKLKSLTLRLANEKNVYQVGKIEFK
jgi:hypothetical protein